MSDKNGEVNKQINEKKHILRYVHLQTFYLQIQKQKTLKIWMKILVEHNSILNTEKTKIIISNKQSKASAVIGNMNIEQLNAYKYLGNIINSTGNIDD